MATDNTLTGTAGNDTLTGGNATNDFLDALAGNDLLLGNGGDDVLQGGDGNDTLNGGTGWDDLTGGAGDDTYYVDSDGDYVIEAAGGGYDRVFASTSHTLAANVERLDLTGTAAAGTGNALDNFLNGNAQANVLNGGAGNDTLNGQAGADLLIGGAGNDTYIVDTGLDRVVENSGGGNDTIQSLVNWQLGNHLENLRLAAGSAAVNATGNALDNRLYGNQNANLLQDDLGNDTLDGGTGNDTLRGGSGNDTYLVDAAGDTVQEDEGYGTDTVNASLDYVLGANLENLVLSGTAQAGTGNDGNNRLTGNGLDNSLMGGLGNDILDGGTGADTLNGGDGNDVYYLDNAGDQVIDSAGYDRVVTRIDMTLQAGVEAGELGGTATQLTGNTLGNKLTGNGLGNLLDGAAGNDLLLGNAGNDTLAGGAGIDTLNGGSGDDSMSGGAGHDTYHVDSARDRVVEAAGEGNDTVIASVDFTLQANVENLTLTGSATRGVGNGQDNILRAALSSDDDGTGRLLLGMGGNDTLYGLGISADGTPRDANMTLVGGDGNDTYRDIDFMSGGGDVIIEEVDGGTDTVHDWYAGGAALYENVENAYIIDPELLAMDGTGASPGFMDVLGNGGNNRIEAAFWSNVNYSIDGGAGNDTLVGQSGNDTLVGGTGIDSLVGGLGSDTYVVDNAGDIVVEATFEGDTSSDIVVASTSYTLAANVERLQLVGSSDINGSGNTGNNLVNGNSGNNQLAGDDGDDSLHGHEGDDSLLGGLGNDSLDGGDGKDSLAGNAGSDTLNGMAGADTLAGGAGDDTYIIDADDAADTILESAGDGHDVVVLQLAISGGYTLAANVEELRYEGTAPALLIGTGGDDILSVNSMASTTVATLQGGAGDDRYVVNTPSWVLIDESTGSGNDTMEVEVANSDGTIYLWDEVENLVANAAGHYDGNAADNLMDARGSSGAVTLNGSTGSDTLYGSAHADDLVAVDAGDQVHAGDGNDDITANGATLASLIDGGDGYDSLSLGEVASFTLPASGISNIEVFQFGTSTTTVNLSAAALVAMNGSNAVLEILNLDPASLTVNLADNGGWSYYTENMAEGISYYVYSNTSGVIDLRFSADATVNLV